METKVFEQRFVCLSPTLYRVAYSLLHNEQDAEDAVQDTLVALWRDADRIEAMDSPKGYAMNALRNRCMDVLRKRTAEADWEDAEEPMVDADIGARMDIGNVLHRLLRALSPKAQKIVRLRHIGDCSMEEISRVTGEREDNIRQILSRSRKQMYQLYQEITES